MGSEDSPSALDTLRELHSNLSAALETAVEDAYGSDQVVTEAFDEWVRKHGHLNLTENEEFEFAAREYAYLLLNRILFYEAIRENWEIEHNGKPVESKLGDPLVPLSQLIQSGDHSSQRIETRLNDAFDDIVTAVNYDAVFESNAPLFDSFPPNDKSRATIRRLIRLLEEEIVITRLGIEFLSHVLGQIVPVDERRRRSKHFTDPEIATALVKWALQPSAHDNKVTTEEELPRVLDPAAGTGVFAYSAYSVLSQQYPEASHQDVLDHIFAVDTDSLPLQLTAINLALTNPAEETNRLNVYNKSFFELKPGLDGHRANAAEKGGSEEDQIGSVDAVIGNPPYIKSSDLYPDASHFRDHLTNFGPEGSSTYEDGEKKIGESADAYVYFVTYATQFLRDGGRLAFVIPTKWMSARYGERFRQFLFDYYKLEAVVGFDAPVFDDVQVEISVVLLEKCDDVEERRNNVVNFIRLYDKATSDTLLNSIQRVYDRPAEAEVTVTATEDFRTLSLRQSDLQEFSKSGNIAHYLFAPAELLEIVDSPELVELCEMADVTRGVMTGFADFFFPYRDDIDSAEIECRFLLPGVKSMKGFDGVKYKGEDIDRWFLDVHDYVLEVSEQDDDKPNMESVEDAVKHSLEEEGYTGLLSWIRNAERNNEHLRSSLRNRPVWFDCGEAPQPEIMLQKLSKKRYLTCYNSAGAVPSNAIDCIDPHTDINSKALFGVLNSSFVHAIMEIWGRHEGKALQLMTGDTKSLPLPDLRSITAEQTDAIVNIVDQIIDQDQAEIPEPLRDELDEVVLETVSEDISVSRIQEIQRDLHDRRVESDEKSTGTNAN